MDPIFGHLNESRKWDAQDQQGWPLPHYIQCLQTQVRWPCLGEWREYWIAKPDEVSPPLLVEKAKWVGVTE